MKWDICKFVQNIDWKFKKKKFEEGIGGDYI